MEFAQDFITGRGVDAALTVEDNSLLPLLARGDLVYIRYTDAFEDGALVAVATDAGMCVGRGYRKPDGILLVPPNSDYKRLTIEPEALSGVVCGYSHFID